MARRPQQDCGSRTILQVSSSSPPSRHLRADDLLQAGPVAFMIPDLASVGAHRTPRGSRRPGLRLVGGHRAGRRTGRAAPSHRHGLRRGRRDAGRRGPPLRVPHRHSGALFRHHNGLVGSSPQGPPPHRSRRPVRIHTIKPGAYPDGGPPAHIHYVISGADFPEQRHGLHFEGDSRITEGHAERSRQRGRFGDVRPLERDGEGVLQCVRDIRLHSG